MLAIVSPGQGAQTPGLLAPWLEVPAAASLLRDAEGATGLDVVRLGTTADADEIRDTAVAQPLLTAAALATAAALDLLPQAVGGHVPLVEAVVAGHSIGELPAAALAGVLTPRSALRLSAVRGRAMALACQAAPTGMVAVLGGDPDEVDAALARHGLVAANRNAAGQVVAAGPVAGLDALVADPPARARLRRLEVAGAFHTDAMAPAQDALGAEVAALATGAVRDPQLPLVMNADGAVVHAGRDVLERLVAQVSAPVRWDLCTATLLELGVDAIVELAPGGTLTGLAKRAMPGVELVAVRTPDDLPAALALIAAQEQHPHGHHHAAPEPGMPFRIAVAASTGSFTPADLGAGDAVSAGRILGEVRGRREQTEVRLDQDAVLVEWLALDGDPVTAGQPLARLA